MSERTDPRPASTDEYLDRATEALLAGDGLVLDERDPEIPLAVRDLWGFYRAIAVERPWVLRGLVALEGVTALALLRRSSTLARLAGVVLATVFAALGVLPLVVLGQLGLIVGLGVLLDTLLVRTVIVPAATALLGDRFWWPGRVASRS